MTQTFFYKGVELVVVRDVDVQRPEHGNNRCIGCFNYGNPTRNAPGDKSCEEMNGTAGRACNTEDLRYMLPVEAIAMKLRK